MVDNNDRRKPVTVITVLCDARKIQRIAVTCRCSLRWIEFIPQELHDSDLIAEFQCSRCATRYHLYHKQLSRVKENSDDRQNTANANAKADGFGIAIDDKCNYDA